MAADMHPFRVFPRGRTFSPAHLPTYCCTVARGCLELGEDLSPGKSKEDIGFNGFAHSCDTMQCLNQIWLNTVNEKTVTFVPPVYLTAAGAKAYTAADLKRTAAELGKLRDREIGEDDLRKAIILNNRVRRVVERLEKLRPYYHSGFISSLVRVAQLAPRGQYVEVMEKNLPDLEEAKDTGSDIQSEKRTNLLISGAMFENEDIHNLLEELGARVVADDSCTGYRHFAGLVDEKANPYEAMASRYAARPNCPCRHKNLNERADYLLGQARERKAEAVLIILRKFCEPHAWDSVSLAETFKKEGIPTLVLEMEAATPGGQERTRLQAFLESLEGGLNL